MYQDQKSMNEFLKSVERRAFRMARLSTTNTDEALDIVQDAMYRFVQKYSNHPRDEWKPLFFKVLHSKIADWGRGQNLRQRFFLFFRPQIDERDEQGDLESYPDDHRLNPENQYLGTSSLAAVEQALRGLPLRQRQAFLLRAREEMSVEESALSMGCSPGSVKTHYFRAVQALREKLKEFET